jgi:uncharacterized protein YceH (UPF0502 family)
MELTDAEIRVLGALIEKEATTPDQYPLSTNALTTACNQKTSRDPVVSYDQRQVSETMLLLRPAGLARTIRSGRTDKHRHVLDEALGLDRAELSVLAVLMLRGPQTPGELRSRTDRAHRFDSVDEVDEVLSRLAQRDDSLVRCLGRGPGQSQDRWTHLLGGLDPRPESDHGAETEADAVPVEPRRERSTDASSSMKRLEERVAELERRIAAIEAEFGL